MSYCRTQFIRLLFWCLDDDYYNAFANENVKDWLVHGSQESLVYPPVLTEPHSAAFTSLSLLQLVEVATVENKNDASVFNKLRNFKLKEIKVEAQESTGKVGIDIVLSDDTITSIQFKGKESSIDLDCCKSAFDFVLRVLLYTESSDARLIIEPSEHFTDELALVHLPSLHLAEDVIKVREVCWAFGAPLQLYVQLEPGTTTVKKFDDLSATGYEALVDLISLHQIEARIVTLFT